MGLARPIERGWSTYTNAGPGKRRKLHYFENGGRSVCGFATLTTWKLKNKFFNPEDFKNPQKVCQRCLKKFEEIDILRKHK